MRRWLSLVGLFVVMVLALPANAQSKKVRDEARELAKAGIAALEAGKYSEALDKLRDAEKHFHAPTHLLYIARAHVGLNELVTAHRTYVEVLGEEIPNYAPPAFHEAKRAAAKEARELLSRVASLRIRVVGVAPRRVSVSIDGEAVAARRLDHPVAVEPGLHEVSAQAPGADPVSESQSAEVGSTKTVTLTLVVGKSDTSAADPEASESGEGGDSDTADGLAVGAAVGLGVGGACLVAGIVTGVMTLSQASDIKDQCTGNVCPPAQEAEAEDAKVLGNVSTAMFVVGGVLSATGISLLVASLTTAPQGAQDARAPRLHLGPGGFALSGAF
jgi:hypothetical protein